MRLSLAVAAIALVAIAPAASAQVPSASGPPPSAAPVAVESGMSAAELDAVLAPLSSGSIDERRAAAKEVTSLGEDAAPAIGRKLADLRKSGDGGSFAAIKAAREHAGKEGTFDQLEALVELRPEPGVTRALVTTALVRALVHAGTTPALRLLVPVASDAAGIMRPELSRQLKALGDRSLAVLIEARRDAAPETRTWAANLLETMGKRMPGDVVQTKDNQVLADVVHAYGSTRDMDALPVVLSFVNSDRAQVRAAAREATLAYGQEALWKLREAYSVLTGEQAPEGTSAADLARKLFDAYDRYRLHDVYALLDKGLGEAQAGQMADAVHDLDEVLARQPMLDRRAEAAPVYAKWGESLEETDRPAALAALRRSLRLDEAGPDSSHVRAEILALEGEDLVARGIVDTEPFEQALALDPDNARAKSNLNRIHAQDVAGHTRTWRMFAAAVVLLLAIAGIFVVGGRRKKPAVI
jgi:tetratricopeptide (TPR) repeat protein